MARAMEDGPERAQGWIPSGRLARAGLAVGVGMQPAVWAAGRWGLLGDLGGRVRELDARGLAWMAARRGPTLDSFFEAATHLGSFLVTGPLALGLALALAARGRRAQAWFVIAALGGAALFAQVGKLLVARPRPESAGSVVAQPADLSFPSAHATQVMALALAVWLVAAGASQGRRGAIAVGGALAVALVALSRVYLQVHYPSDVAAGLVGAAAWVLGLRLAIGMRA